mmetsp:Transcript_54327/g.157748  ORF Transcript_54327/g.157748 Transcript_54327/m.157748 type:complete len:309 (+) Transcript_54327:1074-2000(+)
MRRTSTLAFSKMRRNSWLANKATTRCRCSRAGSPRAAAMPCARLTSCNILGANVKRRLLESTSFAPVMRSSTSRAKIQTKSSRRAHATTTPSSPSISARTASWWPCDGAKARRSKPMGARRSNHTPKPVRSSKSLAMRPTRPSALEAMSPIPATSMISLKALQMVSPSVKMKPPAPRSSNRLCQWPRSRSASMRLPPMMKRGHNPSVSKTRNKPRISKMRLTSKPPPGTTGKAPQKLLVLASHLADPMAVSCIDESSAPEPPGMIPGKTPGLSAGMATSGKPFVGEPPERPTRNCAGGALPAKRRGGA